MSGPDLPSSIELHRPIFIVGCPRSGTSLLRRILDSHPSISCGPESRILWGFRTMEENNWSTLVGFGLSLEQWRTNVRSFFESLHRNYADQQGKARWADKSPDYALMLDYIDTLYPECQIVHIVRDPRDVVDAWRRFYGPKSLARSGQAWVRYVGSAHRFAAAQLKSKMIELRYEDLVREPEPTLRQLLEWLGEPWDERVLDFARQPHSLAAGRIRVDDTHLPAEQSRIRTTSIGVGKSASTTVPHALVRRTGGDLMRYFGYG
jgi:Sulfotransferase family